MKRHDQNTSHARPTRGYKPLAAALMLAGLAHTGTAQAALTAGTVLQYTAGYTTCTAYNAKGKCIATDTLGTYFTMDTNGDGTKQPSEKTKFAPGPDGGIVMGVTQDTNGHTSHSGAPHAGVGGIDAEWGFFSNAGMVYTSVAIADQTGSGATRSLDFRGWTVTWNGIPTIPMGGDVANFSGDTRLATIVCSSANCANGDTFTLTYAAHVPLGDVSGFGGVYYTISMVGTIAANTPPVASNNTQETTSTNAITFTPTVTDADATDTVVCGIVASPPGGEGTVSVASGSCAITYTPGGFAGPQTSFTYRASDGYNYSNTATVTVNITATPRPICNADTASASGTTAVSIAVLSNDAPIGSATLNSSTVAIGTAAGSGTATANADGTITYTSTSGAGGTDTFTYTVQDSNSQTCTAATVTVTVSPVTVAPDISYSKTTSGCSLTGSRINPTERGDWWIVAGFLAWLGALRMRFKRQTQS